MRTWITCTTLVMEGKLSQLRELLDEVAKNTKAPFSAQATHAAQTVGHPDLYTIIAELSRSCFGNRWKPSAVKNGTKKLKHGAVFASIRCSTWLVRRTSRRLQGRSFKLCISSMLNFTRKSIMCALARGDYEAARLVFSMMSEIGREDRVTRYLMYKVALRSGQPELGTLVCICTASSANVPPQLPNVLSLYVDSH